MHYAWQRDTSSIILDVYTPSTLSVDFLGSDESSALANLYFKMIPILSI